MGFFDGLLHGAARLFSKQCPKCGANDADLPNSHKIIKQVVQQRQEIKTGWEPKPDGSRQQILKVYDIKDVQYGCRVCGYSWMEQEKYLQP